LRFAGELASLGTAFCWALGSNLFAVAGRSMRSSTLNLLRITVALGFLMLALWVRRGAPWPAWATPEQLALLSISGVIGFVLGDGFYFRALVILGPGRAALLGSLAPIFTVAIGWPLLGETPGAMATLGIALTSLGVFLVLRDRGSSEEIHAEGSHAFGVLAGLLAALGQAVGYVISKQALWTGIDALSATVIRIAAAAVVAWAIASVTRDLARAREALSDGRATAFMAGGALFGPFLGVTLSLTALQHIEAGVAASIMASYPVITILISARLHGERLTGRVFAGMLVAVAGVIVLFLR
jgi:drug/metabolite transporter (DMT)-like permease